MDIRKVKKLIELLEASDVAEIEIQEGEESVRISRGTSVPMPAPVSYQAAPAPAPVPVPAAASVPPPAASPAAAQTADRADNTDSESISPQEEKVLAFGGVPMAPAAVEI